MGTNISHIVRAKKQYLESGARLLIPQCTITPNIRLHVHCCLLSNPRSATFHDRVSMSAVIVRPRVQCVLRTATLPKPRQRMPRGTRSEGREPEYMQPWSKVRSNEARA